MKILVVSHNVFSKTSNMGKTLASYFEGIDSSHIAQFYIHSEIPTHNICKNYYRITDKEAIKSIFTRRSGRVLGEDDVREHLVDSRTDTGNTARLYLKARKRSPVIYFARNLWWNLGKWKTKKLKSWLDEFNPDVVFFASGDYAFMYKIALWISRYKKIPLVVSCMDDYYFYNKNANRFGGRFVHKAFMKQVKKTMNYASCIYPICEKMGREYGELFGKPYHTLCTPSTISEPLKFEKSNLISYIGNLGYKRNEQLVAIGRALKDLDVSDKPNFINVYSAEKDPEILKDLNEENGIKFCGSISADKVIEVMGQSLAVIHTESFDESMRKSVRYSMSTKIADSLASGTPILAFGPKEIASIEYLIDNNAAFCAVSTDELPSVLKNLLCDIQKKNEIVNNAIKLANKNHNSEKNCGMIKETLKEVCVK